MGMQGITLDACFARQQWRAWIETCPSPRAGTARPASPVSNGGRGLKQKQVEQQRGILELRPSAMAGVD